MLAKKGREAKQITRLALWQKADSSPVVSYEKLVRRLGTSQGKRDLLVNQYLDVIDRVTQCSGITSKNQEKEIMKQSMRPVQSSAAINGVSFQMDW